MWIIKGISLGSAVFVVGTILFLIAALRRSEAKSTGLTVITGMTTQNWLWWAAFGASLVVGCWLVGTWPVKL